MMPEVEFSLLGPLVVRRDSTEVPVAGERARRTLALLALSAGRPVSVDRLVEEVWESPPEGAPNALQSLVSRLRRSLGRDAPIEREGDSYRLAVAPERVDAWRFERELTAARTGEAGALERALAEWHGEPLVGLGDSGVLAAERVRLQNLHRAALTMRAAARLEAGGDPTLAGDLQALSAANPLDEELHALLLRALVAAGREAEALTRYEDLRQRLREELGCDPAPALQALHRAILRHDPQARPSSRRVEGPTNLRRPLTSFVGRDEDRRRLMERLQTNRLVTIVGTGGAGKTRLAQEVAAGLRTHFDGGVWLVELAAVREEEEVTRGILGTLAPHVGTVAELLRSLAGEGLPGLVAALDDRRLLLLLDNCEQVAARCAEVAEALAGGTAGVVVLATSREPLGVAGEMLWPVGPLGGDGEGLGPAVHLFADRAQAVDPSFRLDDETRPLVERICSDLDRLPLAIELAAARLRTLTLGEIAERLADRFRLLGAGRRRGVERHQTLRAVVDWSWDLLLPVERTLLRRLAVLADGCDVEAVESTCAGLGGDDLAPDQAFEVLSALVDRSLVATEERGGRTFYRLLETVRAYALDRLHQSGEEETVRAAHARWCCRLAEAADPHLRGREQHKWLDRLDAVEAELRGAIQWAISARRKELAVRLGAALGWYLGLRGLRDRHREWLQAALELPGEIPALLRARALVAMVHLGMNPAADPVRDPGYLAEARDAFAAAGVPPSDDLRLRELAARMPQLREHPEEGPRLSEDLAALRQEATDPWVRAASWPTEAFALIAWVPEAERRGRVEEAFARAVEDCRRVGDDWALAVSLTGLSVCAQARGERAAAEAYLDEAFHRSAHIGWSEDVVWVLIALTVAVGVAASAEGSLTAAWGSAEMDALMERGLDQAQRLRTSTLGVAAGYVFLGSLAQRRGDVDLTARCFSLSLAQELPGSSEAETPIRVVATTGLAWARERQGRPREVWPLLRQAAEILRGYGADHVSALPTPDGEVSPEVAMGLVWLAGCSVIAARTLLREGNPGRALTLLGAAAAAASRLPRDFRKQMEDNWLFERQTAEDESRARAQLRPAQADAAFARGQSMPWRDLLSALRGGG